MKIAVTSTGTTLDDTVESRFGRCAYFLIVDLDTMDFEAVDNANIALGGGAGIQSAQLMAEKGVSAVLTGNCGPNAFQTFGATNIQVITGVSGQVRQAVEQYKSGALSKTSSANVESHFGMGGSSGTGGTGGMSRGMGGGGGCGRGIAGGGRGMGGSSGMGRGMGMGAGMGIPAQQNSGQSDSASLSEVKNLKNQLEEMRKQLETLQSSINSLKK